VVHMPFGPIIPAAHLPNLIYMKLVNHLMLFRELLCVGKRRGLWLSSSIRRVIGKFHLTICEVFPKIFRPHLSYIVSCRKSDVGKPAPKALGDPVARITSQVIANYSHDFLCNDIDSFVTLARGYIFEGTSREEICAYNSGVSPRFQFFNASVMVHRLPFLLGMSLQLKFGCSLVHR
jgi:hypothetical protein